MFRLISRFLWSLAFLWSVALIATTATAALAQDATPAPSPQPSEIGRVTTSDRQEEPITRTSRPTYLVDRRAIEASGARTVADALRTVPGFSLFRYGAFGAQGNYGLLGATSAQTLVLLDGFPIAAASSGDVDLTSLSTTGVSRIEVVEGGGSTLYGSSAVGGIINIITAPNPPGPYALLSTGSFGERDARVEAGGRALSVSFERHLATNNYAYPGLDGFPAGTRTNSGAAATGARISYKNSLGPAYTLDGTLSDDAVSTGVPGRLDFPAPNARQATSRLSGHLTLTHHGERSALSLSVAAAKQSLLYNDPDSVGENDTYDARTQVSLRDVTGDERSSLVTGLDFSRETASLFFGPSATPPLLSAALSQSAAYAQYSRAISPATRLSVGLRGERDTPQGSVLVPSFGATAVLGTARLAVNYSGSFRAPTIDDLYYPGFSNPHLQPERARTMDATLSVPANGGTVSLNWFSREAVNLIALDANFDPQNVARASIGGLVLSARSAPVQGIVASLAVTNLFRAVDRTPGQPQTRLAFEPAFTVLLGLERALSSRPRSIGFGVNARVESPHVESGSLRNGETTVDLYGRIRVAPEAVLTLRSRNIGNERYAPILGYPAAGRGFEVELSTR